MTFLQLGFSALAAAGLLALAVIFVIAGAVELLSGGLASPEAAQQFLLAYSLAFIGLLCLPSVWTSFQQLLKNSGSAPQKSVKLWSRVFPNRPGWDAFRLVTLLLIIGLPASLALGHLAAQSDKLAWLLLPPLNLVATGLPVLWLALLGMRKLDGGSAQRKWGLLASGLVIGPVWILTAEVILLVVAGMLVMIYLSTQPELMSEFRELVRQIRNMTAPDQEALLRMLEPYLRRPSVMLGTFLMMAVFAPLIEELLKPIGLWLLSWKKLTPAQGLVAGILSGAGFALFENLGNTSGAGGEWALVALSRIPAALLHMVTTGMVGWALASAWSGGRYWKLAATYAAAVTIHGLWNGLAVLGAATIPAEQSISTAFELPAKGMATVVALVVLCIFNFILYLLLNRSLRPKPEAQAPELITN